MWFGFNPAVNFCHFSTLLRCDINFTEVVSIFTVAIIIAMPFSTVVSTDRLFHTTIFMMAKHLTLVHLRGFGIQTSTCTERKATLIFFGSTGVLNVKTYVFVGLITPFLRTLTLRTPMRPCSFKFSRMSLSLQGRSSGQRMTLLEELR